MAEALCCTKPGKKINVKGFVVADRSFSANMEQGMVYICMITRSVALPIDNAMLGTIGNLLFKDTGCPFLRIDLFAH